MYHFLKPKAYSKLPMYKFAVTAQLHMYMPLQNSNYPVSNHIVKVVPSQIKPGKVSFSKEGCHPKEALITEPSRFWHSLKYFRSPSGLKTLQPEFNEGRMASCTSNAIHNQILPMYKHLCRLEPENTVEGTVAALPFPLWLPTSAWQLILFLWHDSFVGSHSFPGLVDRHRETVYAESSVSTLPPEQQLCLVNYTLKLYV